jgi:hypothetical protein
MARWQRGFCHGVVLGGLLLAACFDDDKAYDREIQKQHEQAAAAKEAWREQKEAEAQLVWEVSAERQQAELAFESDAPAILSEQQLHQVIGYYCGDCHFYVPCGSCEWGGHYLDSVKEMISERTLIPGDAEGSAVVQQMREHRAHLPDGVPAVTDTALRLVTDFINQLPEPDAGVGH